MQVVLKVGVCPLVGEWEASARGAAGHLLPPHTAASLMTPPNPYSNTSSLPHWKISSHTLAAAAAAVAAAAVAVAVAGPV